MMYRNALTRFCLVSLIFSMALASCGNKVVKDDNGTLKDAFEGKFLIGAALNTDQADQKNADDVKLIQAQFNSIVSENCMKHEQIHPQKDVYNFADADKFVAFGVENNMFVVGHCLVWHSQTAPWMFVDDAGDRVSRDTLIARMKDHIYTIVGRYKGRVNGWDVVNEAISDSLGMRASPWTEIIGEDFIPLAFQFAHEADPDAELYYNDYNMYDPRKRADAITVVKAIQAAGCRIDGIGMQAHYGLTSPDIKDVENSIVAYSDLGLKVMFTELDISVLPFPSEKITAEISVKYANSPEYDPYKDGLPDSVQLALSKRYEDLFGVFMAHSDVISRVTFWGLNNSQTWRNYWPIAGRTDYPLLFDRNNKMVPAGEAIIKMVEK